MPPKDHFKNKCYKNWREKRVFLHENRADLVLLTTMYGVDYVLKHYEISYRIYREHVDSYMIDAGEPDRKVHKTTRRKPKKGGT